MVDLFHHVFPVKFLSEPRTCRPHVWILVKPECSWNVLSRLRLCYTSEFLLKGFADRRLRETNMNTVKTDTWKKDASGRRDESLKDHVWSLLKALLSSLMPVCFMYISLLCSTYKKCIVLIHRNLSFFLLVHVNIFTLQLPSAARTETIIRLIQEKVRGWCFLMLWLVLFAGRSEFMPDF